MEDQQFTVVVPTINSARWIADLHHYYDSIGVDPFYCIDSRTYDNTAGILAGLGARHDFVSGEQPWVESLIVHLKGLIDTRWIFRIDDDECPSSEAIAWIRWSRCEFEDNVVSFPRKWLHFSSEKTLIYSATADWDWSQSHNGEDRQFRLYRKDAVAYSPDIHTPGFIVESAARAPLPVCLYHFNWILYSKAERLAKIAHYQAQQFGDSSWMKKYYIWEDMDEWTSRGEIVDDKVLRLATRLARV
jgi:hypothetical protein